jgi:hypothetical protein
MEEADATWEFTAQHCSVEGALAGVQCSDVSVVPWMAFECVQEGDDQNCEAVGPILNITGYW